MSYCGKMPDDEVVTTLMLHGKISDLLAGAITFGEFSEWLAGSTWEDSDVTPDALPLVRSVQLVLAEFSSGHRTWPDVRHYLVGISQWVQIQVSWNGAPTFTTGTGSVNRLLAFTANPPSATSIRLEVVSGSSVLR